MARLKSKLNIAILAGGPSSEREVSWNSGQNIFQALKRSKKYKPFLVEITRRKEWRGWDQNFTKSLKISLKPHRFLVGKERIHLTFIALHGKYGEDGTVQGLLEALNIPYTGSGILASSLAMNKLLSKKLFQEEGLPTPPFEALRKDSCLSKSQSIKRLIKKLGLPLVIKPVAQGSSIGVTIAKNENEIRRGIKNAFKWDEVILVEKYIKGREIQVGILGNKTPQPLPPVEIIPQREFFDYQAKYNPLLAEEIIPAPLTRKQSHRVQEICLNAYRLLQCQGFARIDTFLNEKGEFLVSEVNTIPGLTKNSLFPKEAEAKGISFLDLIERIIELGWELGTRS